jgi:hypothetical protein
VFLRERYPVNILPQSSAGTAIFAPEWVNLCAVLDVVPRACRPYRAKTKGKVERVVREVKESFLGWLTGQILPTSPTIADYDRFALQWRAEIVLPRRHRTTGKIVSEAWEEEGPLLRPLPVRLRQHPANPVRPLAVVDPTARLRGEHVQIRDLADYEAAIR